MTMTDSNLIAQTQRILDLANRQGAIDRLSDEERGVLGAALKSANRRVRPVRLHLLFPDTGPRRRELYPKHIEHFTAGAQYKARIFMAGNRIGKSWAGGYETTCHATGWYPDWWKGWRRNEPSQILIGAKTTKTLKKVTQKVLFGRSIRGDKGRFKVRGDGMVPPEAILHDTAIFTPNAPGTLSEIGIRFRDSVSEWSMLELCSYEQGRAIFEGTEYDFAWLDEECDEEIYSEAITRLMTTEGRMIITFTPLDGLTKVVIQFLGADYKPPEVYDEAIDELV